MPLDNLDLTRKITLPTTLELARIVFTLKVSRHHLYSVKFEVYSDHKSLQNLFDQKELNKVEEVVEV